MERITSFVSSRGKGVTLSAIFLTCLLAGCKAPQIAETEYGKVKGAINTEQRTIEWRGIPYAEPPVGELRWQAPQPPQPWDKTQNATQFSKACPQLGSMYGPADDGFSQDLSLQDTFDLPIGQEDCLYLNIQRPLNLRKQLPVVVYLHGGSHVYGAGALYDGSQLTQQGVVFVTINYRLGLIGWLNHPALKTGENDPSESANFGTLDILQALTFIKNNIAAFGGNPDNITLMGQSAGASHVFSMMTSPLAHDLFQRAVMLSPGLLNQTPETGLAYANGLLVALVIMHNLAEDEPSAAAFLAEQDAQWIKTFLYSMSSDTLITATSLVPSLRIAPAIFLDGQVQPADPYAAVASGQFNNVPVLMGITSEEGKLFTQNGMLVDSKQLWNLMQSFNPDDPASSAQTLEDIIAPELLPADRPQQGTCGAEDFVSGGYDDFANLCGALAPTAVFQYLQNDVLLPLLSTQQSQLYAYEWSWNQQPFPWNVIHGSVHAGDIGFMLGLFDTPIFNNGYSIANEPGRLDLSQAMQTALVNFAKNADPNHAALTDTWLPWSPLPASPKRLLFDADDQEKQVMMQFE